MPWNSGLKKLHKLLADLYRTEDRAHMAVTFAGLDTAKVSLRGAAEDIWFRILEEAERQDKIGALVDQACKNAPSRCDDLTQAYDEYRAQTRPGTLELDQYESAKIQIIGYMKRKRYNEVRFKSILKYVLPHTRDEAFLDEVIDRHPTELYRVTIKGERGVGRYVDE